MIAALLLPRLLNEKPDRSTMLGGAALMTLGFLVAALVTLYAGPLRWPAFLLTWGLIGVRYSMTQTPSGRLLKRSAQAADRPAVFAAQLSLSHACWLITYPLAGRLATGHGMVTTLVVLGFVAAGGAVVAMFAWPARDDAVLEHTHPGPDAAGHLGAGERTGAHTHRHDFLIDDLHPVWPTRN